jgi:insulysin
VITVHCINHYLSMHFNQEMKIGFSVNLNIVVSNGLLILNINGPNSKYDLFYNKVLKFLKKIKLDSYVIKLLKKKIKQNLINIKKLNPWDYLSEKINEMFNPYEYSDQILLKEINNIKNNDIKKNIYNFFNLPVRNFTLGNLVEKDLDNLMKLDGESKIPELFKFNKIKSIRIKHPNRKEINNCIQVVYPIFKYSELNALLIFALQLIANQPFFYRLRTQEQLGYLVRFGKIKIRDSYYITQKIQSEKPLKYIKEKIDKFNEEFYDSLLKMDSNTWTNWKKTIRTELKKRDESTKQQFNKYLNEIVGGEYKFNRNELILHKLNELKLIDLQNLYKNKIYKTKKEIVLEIKGN